MFARFASAETFAMFAIASAGGFAIAADPPIAIGNPPATPPATPPPPSRRGAL
jgi:hypothetical protein